MKKLVGSSVVALAGLVLFSGVALAAETEAEALLPKTNKSDLSITFKGDKPNDGVGPYKDALSFTFAPTTFAFGEVQADFSNNAEFALTSSHFGKQYVVVNDDRRDDDKRVGKRWAVNVEMAPIQNADKSKTISGELVLGFDDVNHYAMGSKMKGNDVDPAEPNGMQLDVDGKPTTTPVVQPWADAGLTAPEDIFLAQEGTALKGSSITLSNAGGSQLVMNQSKDRTAADKTLRGQEGYASKINKASIKFTDVDSSSVGETFSTTLTWVLTRSF